MNKHQKKELWENKRLTTATLTNKILNINSDDIRASENLGELSAISTFMNSHIKSINGDLNLIKNEDTRKIHIGYIHSQKYLAMQIDWQIFKVKIKLNKSIV
jgi:hypothetical protein